MSETKPTEAPTAGMEAWVKVHAHSVHPQDGDGYGPNARIRIVSANDAEVKAREIDATISSLKDALAAAEAKACGLAEALERYRLYVDESWEFEAKYGKPEFEDSSISHEAFLTRVLRDPAVAALTDARCSHAARVETLEEALRSIAANSCCDGCQEAALVAASALSQAQEPG